MKYQSTLLLILLLTVSRVFGQVEKIIFEAPLVYPEGTAFDPKTGNFYVSSVKTGTVGKVDAKGVYSVFYKDPSLKSSYGMKVDAKRNILLVCVADPNYSIYADSATHKKMSRVIALDLVSGKKTMDVDLAALMAGKHFANDLALDKSGNAYVTDSFSPVIYKIDTKGNATVFAMNDHFKSIDVGLNGIIVHDKGYLLVAHSTNGSVLKVDLKDPGKVSVVKVSNFFPGADGLLLDEKSNLILVQNKGVDKVFQLSSKDDWASAEIEASTSTEDRFQNPTTAAATKDGIFVLNAKMNELADSTRAPSKDFSLQRVMLKPVR